DFQFIYYNMFKLVPTLRVGTPSWTLRVPRAAARRKPDAERRRRHSDAERRNEGGEGRWWSSEGSLPKSRSSPNRRGPRHVEGREVHLVRRSANRAGGAGRPPSQIQAGRAGEPPGDQTARAPGPCFRSCSDVGLTAKGALRPCLVPCAGGGTAGRVAMRA